MTPPIINQQEFVTFCLVLVRVSMILMFAPIFGSETVPTQVKIVLILALTFAVSRIVRVDPEVFPKDPFAFIPLIVSELLIGLTIALLVRLVLEAVQYAGELIGYEMGFSIANAVDPSSGLQASVVSQIGYIVALLVFLSANGHHLIIQVLVNSFSISPVGAHISPDPALIGLITRLEEFFILAIKLAAPSMAILFFSKVAMGIVAKTVPQMNILFVGMPLYIIIGLFMFGISFPFFTPLIGREIAALRHLIPRLLGAL